MLDTLDVAQQLTDGGVERRQADRTEIAGTETRLIRWMVGTVIATVTLTVGLLRLLGG